jgi:tRNA nucleotidyltransferase/poly(A) polymerase
LILSNCKDIVTDAKIEDIVKLFPYKSHGKITEKFLVHAFMYEHCSVEIASFRDEGTIENRNSLPKYGTIKTDWLRRDFTMNSIYWNPISNEFIDPSGFGISDVKNKLIRTTRKPETVFAEDQIRILRAIRFQRTLFFDFTFDPKKFIKAVDFSTDRVKQEVRKIPRFSR